MSMNLDSDFYDDVVDSTLLLIENYVSDRVDVGLEDELEDLGLSVEDTNDIIHDLRGEYGIKFIDLDLNAIQTVEDIIDLILDNYNN